MSRLRSPRLVVVLGLILALFVGVMAAAERSASAMATAANRLLSSLTPQQRQQATFAFESSERLKWNFIPTETFPRSGLTIKSMTEAQRVLARELLKSGLSQRGYLTATAVMDLESILRGIENSSRIERDPEKYFFSVFGTPSPRGAWGWRVEGHHVSLHFSVVNGNAVASSPTFFGSNPAEVRSGPKQGLRVLAEREDAARTLVMALDATQRKTALINNVPPNEILTENKLDINPIAPAGVKAAALNAGQRDLLMKLIDVYTSVMADDIQSERMNAIRKAGIEQIAFAWAGETERGRKHYYRIQGPTFLVEYDNTQNDGNHVHSVWRDFNGDFGRDLLREHLQASAH